MREILSPDKINVNLLDKEYLEDYKRKFHKYVTMLAESGKSDQVVAHILSKNGYDTEPITVSELLNIIEFGEDEKLNEIILYCFMYDIQAENDEDKAVSKMIRYFNMDTVELILQVAYPETIMKIANT